MKFNRRYNLRQKAAHILSIKTKEKEKLSEFTFPEREGGSTRITTVLVNSQTFHNNRMSDKQFRQLLQALVQKPMTNMLKQRKKIYYLDCMLLSCHVRVSE